MISATPIVRGMGTILYELIGKSTDTKPTVEYDNNKISNASRFIEMDTGSIYFYDIESSSWLKFGG